MTLLQTLIKIDDALSSNLKKAGLQDPFLARVLLSPAADTLCDSLVRLLDIDALKGIWAQPLFIAGILSQYVPGGLIENQDINLLKKIWTHKDPLSVIDKIAELVTGKRMEFAAAAEKALAE